MAITANIAFDSTARSIDADGRLHIAKSHISKVTVNPYYGREIPNSQSLGLNPDKIYYMFRDPIELSRAASTFERLPILSKHVPISTTELPKELIVGAIGSDVEFSDPYLDADTCFWDAEAIAGIETETVREFSCSYRYVADMTPGEYKGMRYDGVMREIHGNHLIICEVGRAGSDVLAADEAITTMKTTKLGKALYVTLGSMSPKLAQDAALLALVGTASKSNFNSDEVSSKLIAMDSALDPKQIKSTFDALLALDAEEKPKEKAEDEEDEKKKAEDEEDDLDSDTADDEEDEEKPKDKKVERAMDAFKKEFRDAEEARRLVRPVVGDVIAQDSAAAIYGFALDQLKVDRTGVKGVAALKALYTLAQSSRSTVAPRVAMDSTEVATQFPNAMRFRSV